MRLIRKITDFPDALRGGALAIGNFDGVHRGHAALIEQLKRFASELDAAAIVFTFDPHPVRILRPDQAPPPLTWTNRKADLLAELGVDAVVAYPTDAQLLQLTPEQFFNQIVVQTMGAAAMVEGPNFYFGRDRQGTVQLLQQYCEREGVRLSIAEPIAVEGQWISSSRIRELIRQGQVAEASQMLTQPYRIRGIVTHGSARGGSLGFPTANLDGVDTLIPGMGVYAGRAHVDGECHWSAIHIGPSPTFGERVPKVEVHLLDFENSIYGQPIEVDFIRRLRDIQRFDAVEPLIQQLTEDVIQTRDVAREAESLRS